MGYSAASTPAFISGDAYCGAHRHLCSGKVALLRPSGVIWAARSPKQWRIACLFRSPAAGEPRGGATTSWAHQEDSIDGFGGWVFVQCAEERRNEDFPYLERFLTVGAGTSVALVLAAFFYFSVSRKGYKFHFDGLFPFLNGSLTSSESNITSHYEGNQSSENILEDKPVITDDAFLPTINNEMSASGEKKQIVSVEADSTQKQALFVLQKLKIIEDDVRPGELCTRREYARWLVKANALLERNARHKIVLPELAGSSFLAAFDDVNADDPDFPFIQALAEVGIVPSKLLVASKSHFSEENSSLNHGTCDFSPESSLSRMDLLNWRAQLEYLSTPVIEEKMLRKNLGFMDLDSVGTDATPALFMDLLAEDKSIVRTVFGNSRRLQPHKPVTKAQAVVALASGRMARAIQAELVRHEMEDSSQLAQMEDIRREMISGGEMRAFWEGKLDEEKARRRKIQEDYLVALSDLKEEKIALERDLADHVKERAALDCQRQLLVSLREEVEQLQGRLADERSNLLTQKEILEEESTELRRQQDAIAEAKSILEVEKEALRILRCWVEEEANKNQMRAKVLEAAAQRWKWNGQLNVPRASPTDSRDECQK